MTDVMERKFLEITDELAGQKAAAKIEPQFLQFDEMIEQIREFAVCREPELCFNFLVSLLEDGDFRLSARNALSLVWLGVRLESLAGEDGGLYVDV